MTRKIPPHLPVVLSLGMVGQIGQVVFLRELLMVFHGNELSFGIILAVWMALVGAGSRFGAVAVERSRRPWLLLVVISGSVPAVLPASVLLIRVLRGFFTVHPGAYLSVPDMAVSCVVVAAPACMLLGAQFVLLARVWREKEGVADTSGAGKTYIGEAAGSVAGGLLFTLLLVRHAGSFHASLLASMLMLAATLWLTGRKKTPAVWLPARLRPLLLGLLAVYAGVFPFVGMLDSWAYRVQWRFFAPEYRLIQTRQSKYGTISVVRREDQYSFFQSGHLVFSTAAPEASAAGWEEQEAVVFAHFSLVQHLDPRRVLLIGGGLRGTLREIARHPVDRIDYVELDEVLTGAALPYVSPDTKRILESPRVRLLHTDGRLLVKTSDETYDMIIVDIPDPATAVVNRYYTEEFFREAAARLDEDGVLVIGAVSTADMRGPAVVNRNAAIYHTLKQVFARVLPAGERFLFFFATNAPEQVSADPRVLQGRYRARKIRITGFSALHYEVLLQEESLRRVNWIIRHHGRTPGAHLDAPDTGPLFPDTIARQEREEALLPPVQRRYFINSDFRPIGYYYTLLFWNVLTRAGHGDVFTWIVRVEPWWILPVIAACLLAALLLRAAGRRGGHRADSHFAVLFAVFTTGLSTMALQIALLFSFQSIYGFVYEMVGLIVAVFMAGLALGAAVTQRLVGDKSNLNVLAGVQLLIALFAGIIAVALPRSAAPESPGAVFLLFSLVTFAAGLLNGADFPLAAACCMALHRRAEKATGMVYGVELFGACSGALAASVVVAPVLGIVACCLLAAIGNATAFAVLMLSRRTYG
ncbi:MAG: fused MFS/spermidine synthase [Spirochaetota bacterium]